FIHNFSQLESKPVDVECLSLLHDIYSRNVPNYNYRGYTIFGKDNNHREIKRYENLKRPVWFVFSGMGSQWPGMGSKLLQFPIISESIQRSHNILMKKGLDLLNIINSTDKYIFDNILKSFVGIAAIQSSPQALDDGKEGDYTKYNVITDHSSHRHCPRSALVLSFRLPSLISAIPATWCKSRSR
ncbi:unnamed protein product, partial [Timema podura]|nr:unnamed protein product [Timema podura]